MTVRVYLGGAIGRYFEPDHVGSIQRVVNCPEIVRYAPRFNDAAVDRARSQCATEFLEWRDKQGRPADVLLQIDSDIVFNPEDAVRICEAAVEHDVVGGMYVTRGKGKDCRPTTLLYNNRRVEFGNDPTPIKVRYLAGGFVAAHRRVYEKLIQDEQRMPLLQASEPHGRFYPFYIPTWTEGELDLMYLSEDWAFCHRAREAGFGVYLDPSVRLLHLGQHPYRMEDLLVDMDPTTRWMAIERRKGGQYFKDVLPTSALTAEPAVT